MFVRVLTESGWKTVGCQRLWDTREVGTRAPVLEAHPLGCLSRVYGSYEHLWAGQVAEALVDLTGGLAERWTLKDLAGTRGQQDGPCGSEPRTCGQLLRLKEHCLISCSVFSPRAGEAWGVRGLVTGPCRDQVGSRGWRGPSPEGPPFPVSRTPPQGQAGGTSWPPVTSALRFSFQSRAGARRAAGRKRAPRRTCFGFAVDLLFFL